MLFIDGEEVRKRLTFERCIPLMREAMIAFSIGETRQLLRSILPLGAGRLLGIMPGAMGEHAVFGAKLISITPENFEKGRSSHQGIVALFDPEDGAPVAIVDASALTAIRTAAASAAATDALARPDAGRLALLGYGEQAREHAQAIARVRRLSSITIWGRRRERAEALAEHLCETLDCPATPVDSARAAARGADIVCTVTSAQEPVLEGAWLAAGAHVNVVGSSYAGPTEVDNALVAMSRFFVDSRAGALAQGAEFLRAKEAGLVDDDHIAGEIGEVFAGRIKGRQMREEITVYKSLGHVAQDLAAAWAIYQDIAGEMSRR
ncbi:ornithine cyclodeaminase family protein [Amphiplicatus metriothermophilus]|uniref:Ornithine cyclodeaminase n=1 Tax=Amphiplicatus metriothermophilus TaxID=1519374 RepID=A0A239PV03_9PROT|nr:ornithine cyclodeaminase family protein [Amphiplicatus metriothermophilus]MBB5519567.1 ornithine cyclodeaminase [Amphiplicatus metriothermophilus]SNT74131.1 ornithine cyclodeaminase [Amphiplicatus metriothermophilus]